MPINPCRRASPDSAKSLQKRGRTTVSGSNPDYDQSYYRSRERWPDFRLEMESLLTLCRLTTEARVLELGCGGGELLRHLDDRAKLAVGVDLSPQGLRLARQQSRTAVLGANAEALPFCQGAFDAVVAQHLVEHLQEPVDAMREWRRVLRAGGVLAIVTPNAAYPDPALFHDPTHLHLFTLESLRASLEEAGFRVVYLSTLFPYLGRNRIGRSASIRLAPLARHLPVLAGNGRSLVAAAARPGSPFGITRLRSVSPQIQVEN